MPELPEVEILVRHLAPLVCGRIIRDVIVRRTRVIRPTSEQALVKALRGARIAALTRRAKYLLFELKRGTKSGGVLLGHLGMTGRMFVQPMSAPLPKHAAVVMDIDGIRFVYEDLRYFGRFTLDTVPLALLGPEPLGDEFSPAVFHAALKRSGQPIKVKLLDQSLVAGVGNIYASEALFVAGISPLKRANKLTRREIVRLRSAIRGVLAKAIQFGSTVSLNFAGQQSGDGLFYYGRAAESAGSYEERLRVYDRAGEPCIRCGAPIRRIVQAARSTFYCTRCQKR